MDNLMRDKFIELVHDLLWDDEDSQRASMIIDCADEYAESMKPQWIPVNERLPEPWDLVLVTDRRKDVRMCQMHHNSSDGWYDECDNWMYFSTSVIAWMPLPELYHGGE